ncbi:hypothetical protein GCM10009332_08070 [Shewanella gelidii]|uniref:Uncharacterized protein n=1 Tax=Shewanella gelidii TaxID=1642821 RepID=A0A917JL80_9GAMM|nr:hypothetical protein GCM10009332_08070 [Shewanella gelidii]
MCFDMTKSKTAKISIIEKQAARPMGPSLGVISISSVTRMAAHVNRAEQY